MLKQDRVLYQIIHDAAHGNKQAGQEILKKDYGLTPVQMAKVFETLQEHDIIRRQQTPRMSYILTENCVENAKEFCLSKIIEHIDEIKLLSQYANISQDILCGFVSSQMDESGGKK